MRLARLAGKLFKWALAAFVLMTCLMLAWTFTWPNPDVRGTSHVDAIACMGGGMNARGTLAEPTLNRVERCVQLYEAGLAPIVIFTGGIATPSGPSAGEKMGEYGVTLGLDPLAVRTEDLAQSTLQNALFTLQDYPQANTFIIVTEGFHLPRSWASFRWAAWQLGRSDMTFHLVMSERVRRDPISDSVSWSILMRESLAIWFNAGRAVLYTVAPNRSVAWLH